MTTTEKLNAIKSKCEELLALAEKRSPIHWQADGSDVICYTDSEDGCPEYVAENVAPEDSVFIAACAGSAEAGWRATIALVEELLRYPYGLSDNSMNALAPLVPEILDAWEGLA